MDKVQNVLAMWGSVRQRLGPAESVSSRSSRTQDLDEIALDEICAYAGANEIYDRFVVCSQWAIQPRKSTRLTGRLYPGHDIAIAAEKLGRTEKDILLPG